MAKGPAMRQPRIPPRISPLKTAKVEVAPCGARVGHGAPEWQVASFCRIEVMARDGVVWQGLVCVVGFELRGRTVSVGGGIRGGAWSLALPALCPDVVGSGRGGFVLHGRGGGV